MWKKSETGQNRGLRRIAAVVYVGLGFRVLEVTMLWAGWSWHVIWLYHIVSQWFFRMEEQERPQFLRTILRNRKACPIWDIPRSPGQSIRQPTPSQDVMQLLMQQALRQSLHIGFKWCIRCLGQTACCLATELLCQLNSDFVQGNSCAWLKNTHILTILCR